MNERERACLARAYLLGSWLLAMPINLETLEPNKPNDNFTLTPFNATLKVMTAYL
jgi:hypothetical protein